MDFCSHLKICLNVLFFFYKTSGLNFLEQFGNHYSQRELRSSRFSGQLDSSSPNVNILPSLTQNMEEEKIKC